MLGRLQTRLTLIENSMSDTNLINTGAAQRKIVTHPRSTPGSGCGDSTLAGCQRWQAVATVLHSVSIRLTI